MGNRRRWTNGWLLGCVVLCCAGCQGNDVERLSKLGAKVAQKAGALLAGGNSPVTRNWQGLRLHWGQVAVDARVAARINWDKTLEGAAIQVEADGTEVKLRGKVPDPSKRRRAVELANSTTGVEKVTDEMEGE